MTRNIEEISIFGEYNKDENRLTAAFLQICKIGGESFLRFILGKIKLFLPSSEVNIISQPSGNDSVPDGLLQSNFKFRLFIESKLNVNDINEIQLENHQNKIESDSDFLVYLTSDSNKPVLLPDSIYWANWADISTWLNQYLQDSRPEKLELLDFLYQNFVTFLTNLGILDQGWNLDNDQVLIVAGRDAIGVAHAFNYYICQNRRSFRSSRYIAFYANDQIDAYFRILEEPLDNCELNNIQEIWTNINQIDPNYEEGDLRRVFRLELVEEIDPIINDKTDRNGNPCPYTYGSPRYTKLEKLTNARFTSEL